MLLQPQANGRNPTGSTANRMVRRTLLVLTLAVLAAEVSCVNSVEARLPSIGEWGATERGQSVLGAGEQSIMSNDQARHESGSDARGDARDEDEYIVDLGYSRFKGTLVRLPPLARHSHNSPSTPNTDITPPQPA